MSRRTFRTGTHISVLWGPGAGFVAQTAVFRAIRHDRGAESRFRCFFIACSPLQPLPPPGIALVEADDDEVRRMDRAADLLLVALLYLHHRHGDRTLTDGH